MVGPPIGMALVPKAMIPFFLGPCGWARVSSRPVSRVRLSGDRVILGGQAVMRGGLVT